MNHPFPAQALADAALAALGGPASVGALLAHYAASKHPLVLARALPAPEAADLFRESLAAAAALEARADVTRRAFLDACADLSYCCGDGPDGDAKYALRLGPPCGAATAAPAPRRRLAVCVTGRDGERSIAYVDDDGDADFPDQPWTEARLFQALGARGVFAASARLAGPGEADAWAAAAARAAGAAGASKAEGKLARHPELYHSGAPSSVLFFTTDSHPLVPSQARRSTSATTAGPRPRASRRARSARSGASPRRRTRGRATSAACPCATGRTCPCRR